MTSVFIREKREDMDVDTQGKKPGDDGGRDWRDVFVSQGIRKTASQQQKLEEARKDSILEAAGGA